MFQFGRHIKCVLYGIDSNEGKKFVGEVSEQILMSRRFTDEAWIHTEGRRSRHYRPNNAFVLYHSKDQGKQKRRSVLMDSYITNAFSLQIIHWPSFLRRQCLTHAKRTPRTHSEFNWIEALWLVCHCYRHSYAHVGLLVSASVLQGFVPQDERLIAITDSRP